MPFSNSFAEFSWNNVQMPPRSDGAICGVDKVREDYLWREDYSWREMWAATCELQAY